MFTHFVIWNDLYFLGLFIENGFYSRLENVIDCLKRVIDYLIDR